ncbi:MAG: VOC family protein [Myxococcaceae bacterium]|nr:VOC family protein [Myxococcaceae bacterium]
MHHSRPVAFVFDVQSDDIEGAARFWAGALGRTVAPPNPQHPTYRELSSASPEEPMLLVQSSVGHESRIHLDIETDDQEAEVKRLEGLGAKLLRKVKTWYVMEAPTGHRFCVVRPQRGELTDQNSNVWP